MKLNRIYTRTGDAGTTGLVDGSRLSKADSRMDAIGDVDEANSAIGWAALQLGGDEGDGDGGMLDALRRIQNDLFDLGADIATPGEDFAPTDMSLRIVAAQVGRLERELDAMNDLLPPLTSFILPGGTPAAAALHQARALTRRAERATVRASEQVPINPQALAYINRLSDWLFVAARVANAGGDVLWVPGGSR